MFSDDFGHLFIICSYITVCIVLLPSPLYAEFVDLPSWKGPTGLVGGFDNITAISSLGNFKRDTNAETSADRVRIIPCLCLTDFAIHSLIPKKCKLIFEKYFQKVASRCRFDKVCPVPHRKLLGFYVFHYIL
eukprot:NODE_230_length_13723_cov_0.393570.p7 type:complete len:132 gc:universal NODE_230_length_13723_cov_0.393570:12711-13106(+)